jgi:3-hydroxyisobutyrate dehydrogenase-like beta-hydroxyacid dehydrogenase
VNLPHHLEQESPVTASIRHVGVIGLGKMGLPIARHIQARKFELLGYDIAEGARAAAVAAGIPVASDIAQLTAQSDFVLLLVGFDREVWQATFANDGIVSAAKPGAILGIASTVAPQLMLRMGERLKGRDLALLDMPLCRGEQAAEDGKLHVMVGGDEAAFAACKPVFDCFADAIFHLGALGAGQVGKMVNNLILWSCISANDEGFTLAERLGVSRERLRDALLESSAGNWAMRTKPEEKPMPWAEKDMRIVAHEADLAHLSVPLCGVVKEVVKRVKRERGWPTPLEPDL